jgi:hypothetical protein
MPGLNRRGPEGEGPMTGRGRGRCNPSNRAVNSFDASAGSGMNAPFRLGAAGSMGQGAGRGMGQGVGRGMGQGAGRGLGQGQGLRMGRRDGSGRRRMG